MFLGTHSPRLDDKGRLFLPAKFRDELQDGLVITRGQEHSLFVWTPESFAALISKVRQTSFTDKRARDFQRMFFAGAADERLDRQGRVTIPPLLRDYARIGRDCVVIGIVDRIEIWDAATWATYGEQHEESFSQLSEEVVPGVI